MPDLMTSTPRIPVFSGTAAAMAAMTGMKDGDIYYTTDTKTTNVYDGAAWNNVLSGVSQDMELLDSTTLTDDLTEAYSLASIASGYKKFIIQVIGKNVTTADTWLLRLNNDSGNNYECRTIRTIDVTDAGYNPNNLTAFNFGAGYETAETGVWNALFIEVSNIPSCEHSITATIYLASRDTAAITTGHYNSTTEINRIDFVANTATRKWKTGSNISVWGVK